VNTHTASTQFDIIIVGGGMVGSALACALGDSGLRIAIVEGRPAEMEWPAEGYDIRVSAITRASQQLFERLGVWDTMREARVSPYREMFVWDATGDGSIHFDGAEIGEPDLGHIIENRVITRALVQRTQQFDNISWFCPASPARLALNPLGEQHLELEDGTRLTAALIVGADGGRSWVREQAGIAVDTRHYEQQALVTTVRSEKSHHDTAWQRFLPSGPLAFLPLTDNHSSIVWSTSPEQAEQLLALSDDAFKQALAEAFDHRLGAITELGPRAAFPLKGQHAAHYVKPGLALIGDAAHTIHPLAGQGVNLGFADAAVLAAEILDARAAGRAFASLKILRRYERARRGDNQLMLEAMGVFKQLFSNDSPWLGPLRNFGLSLTDRLAPAKRLFMRQAMGLPHQLPRQPGPASDKKSF
jgi:2-octaprenylphenol hydroxylase